MRARWLERLVASVCGYFWLPCPLCGEMFSGRETHGEEWGSVWTREGDNGRSGKIMCPRCTAAGIRVSGWALDGRSATFHALDGRYEMPAVRVESHGERF